MINIFINMLSFRARTLVYFSSYYLPFFFFFCIDTMPHDYRCIFRDESSAVEINQCILRLLAPSRIISLPQLSDELIS